MRYVFSGGGTAGHINPAIALADKLKELDYGSEIFFIGSKNGMENKLVSLAGYPIWQIDVKGLKRSLSFSNIGAVLKARRATLEAKEMIKKLRPDAVIGTGGYVCYPVIKAASELGIYTALHESNAVPGLAVKVLRHRADAVFTGFPTCAKKLGGKCLGNPLRSGFTALDKAEARKKLGIDGKYRYLFVSFGGSLGAHTVNAIALNVMLELTSKRTDVLHVHACGKTESESFFEAMREKGLDKAKNIRVSEYIYDMPMYLSAADAVMCRSGAMTLSEIAAVGVPSLLVPSPNVTGKHQLKNALEYERAGAAFLVDERKHGYTEAAVMCVSELLTSEGKRTSMSGCVSKLSHTDASERIAAELIETVKGRAQGKKK